MYQVLEEQNRRRPNVCSSQNYSQALKSIVQGAHVENPCAVNRQMSTSCSSCPRHWIVLDTLPRKTHTPVAAQQRFICVALVVATVGKLEGPCQAWPACPRSPPASPGQPPFHQFAISFSLPASLGASLCRGVSPALSSGVASVCAVCF